MFPAEICAAKLPDTVVGFPRLEQGTFSLSIAGGASPRIDRSRDQTAYAALDVD